MIKMVKSIFLLIIITLSFGCATYHIPTKSLVEQVIKSQPDNKTTVLVAFPFFIPFSVNGNSLTELKVLDKDEKEYVLRVTNQTSIRITKKDGSKKTFYFNTLLIKDSTITGKMDHFIGTNIKPINLNNIDKIELQKH